MMIVPVSNYCPEEILLPILHSSVNIFYKTIPKHVNLISNQGWIPTEDFAYP